jgi:hypothetical protein
LLFNLLLQCEWRGLDTPSSSVFFVSAAYFAQIVTSSPFLVALCGLLASGNYFFSARLARWEHEVAVLRETADGERKFLVKKLRGLHQQVHAAEGEGAGDDGGRTDQEIKNDLKELNEMRAEHYNGVGTMPVTASEYNDQHLATKGMTRTAELHHRKVNRDKRKKKRQKETSAAAASPSSTE